MERVQAVLRPVLDDRCRERLANCPGALPAHGSIVRSGRNHLADLSDRRLLVGRPVFIEAVVDKVVFELDRAVRPDDVIEPAVVVRARRLRKQQVGDPALLHAVGHRVGDRVVALGVVQLWRSLSISGTDPLYVVVRPVPHDIGLVNSGLYYRRSRPCPVGGPDPVCRATLFFGVGMLDAVVFDATFSDHRHRSNPLALEVVCNIGVAAIVTHLESNGAGDPGFCDGDVLADDVVQKQRLGFLGVDGDFAFRCPLDLATVLVRWNDEPDCIDQARFDHGVRTVEQLHTGRRVVGDISGDLVFVQVFGERVGECRNLNDLFLL